MAIHVKTKWHTAANKTSADTASIVATTIWKIGIQTVDHLDEEHFHLPTIPERFAVLAEILIFLIQVTDRWSHNTMDDNARASFITTITLQLATISADNQQDVLGVGNYRANFLDRFNTRAQEYANFTCAQEEPGYQLRRYLGERVLAIMGAQHDNRWVMDQIMDIEIPTALKTLKRVFLN